MSKLKDEQIVERVVLGDVDSFGTLIDRYQTKLIRYVNYLLNNSELTEDIVQETFIRGYQNIKSFNAERKFSSWIYRIAHNTAINHIKKQNRTISIDISLIGELFSSKKDNPEIDYEKKEIQKTVRKCLNKLNHKYKEVLILYYLEDKSYKEISSILEIPIGTVGIRISRAKKALKNICQKI